MNLPHYDDLTIERFKIPRFSNKDFEEALLGDQKTPALWKDLTLASLVAALLWMVAAAVFA